MRRVLLRQLLLAGMTAFFMLLTITGLTHIKEDTVRLAGWFPKPKWIQRVEEDGDPRSRVIVMAKMNKENTSWVENELPTWQRAIYTVDLGSNNNTDDLTVARNKGREANAYLTYIITNYHDLPNIIVFLHSHRDGDLDAWHVDNKNHSNVESIRRLRLDHVEAQGYVNLRCEHVPGCGNEIMPLPDHRIHIRPLHPSLWMNENIAIAWPQLFGGEIPLPEVIGATCCAQFAVSKAQVLLRPLKEYEHYHQWLMETEIMDGFSGRVMEYVWHVIFRKPVIFCPDMQKCYCDVYGACNGTSI